MTDEGISHHGHPYLTQRDIDLLMCVSKWMETAQKWNESYSYRVSWIPSEADYAKSRLFWRIRSGKDPLLEPPPTSFSCPWYELVELLEPHDCWDVHFPEGQVVVNQCAYNLVRTDGEKRLVGFHSYRFWLWQEGKVTGIGVDGPRETNIDQWWLQRDTTLESWPEGS